ncbi:hypothetical protein ES708_08757 [subsurface metagenome]
MAHGHPDYGISAPSHYLFPIVSWEDWFMRQGLIKTMDGKGDIIFYDSFQEGMSKWYQVDGDADSYVQLSPTHARGGNWALEHVIGAAGIHRCESAATIPITTDGKYGVEEHFTFYSDFYYWYVKLYYYAGTKYYGFEVMFNPNDFDLYYFGPGGAYTSFAHLDDWPNEPSYYFNPVKLVIDTEKLKYVRAIVLGESYDLSDRSPAVDTLYCSKAIQPRFKHSWLSGAFLSSHLDDVIVTINEP